MSTLFWVGYLVIGALLTWRSWDRLWEENSEEARKARQEMESMARRESPELMKFAIYATAFIMMTTWPVLMVRSAYRKLRKNA